MTEQKEELKPCPFGGANVELQSCHTSSTIDKYPHFVSCIEWTVSSSLCTLPNHYNTPEQAIAAWNTHPTAAATPSAVDVEVLADEIYCRLKTTFALPYSVKERNKAFDWLVGQLRQALAGANSAAEGLKLAAEHALEILENGCDYGEASVVKRKLSQALAGAAQKGDVPSDYVMVKKQDLEDIWQDIDSMAERPYDSEPEFSTCLAIGGFVRKRVAALTAAPQGE